MDLNVRYLRNFSQYGDDVPAFLQNRLKGVMAHIMNNFGQPDERSAKRVKQVGEVEFMEDGKLRVEFGNDSTYPHCDCSEWRHHRLPCKHFCINFSNIPGWDWEKLSSLYRESPILNLDYTTSSASDNQGAPKDLADTSRTDIPQEIAEPSQQEMQTLPLPPKQSAKLFRYTAGQY